MNYRIALTLISLFLGLTLTAGPYFFLQPKRRELIQLQSQIEAINAQIKDLTSRLVDVRRQSHGVKSELMGVKAELSQKMLLMPNLADISKVTEDIVNRGAGLGLEFVSVLPGYDMMFMDQLMVFSFGGEKIYELPMRLLLRGRYRQLAEYLAALKYLPYYSHINEVELKLRETPGQPGLLEMNVNLRIFYF